MLRVQVNNIAIKRKKKMRGIAADLVASAASPGENLVQLVKVLRTIEVSPERLEFNSKYIQANDGSVIEY